MTTPVGWEPGPLGPDARFAILQRELMHAVGSGCTVEGQWPPDRAIVCQPARVNHVMHAILTLLTFGFWLLVRLLIAISSKPVRTMVYVDEAGQVHRSPAGVPNMVP